MKPKIAAVILAAGASTRMGEPKQLLRIHGRTLLRCAVDAALESAASRVVVVLGSHADLLRMELHGLAVDVVHNPAWREGMGASIAAGVAWLLDCETSMEAVVLVACDQPCLTPAIIDQLIEKFSESGCPIVASAYENTLGIPALFSRKLFTDLLQIEAGSGAKSLILERPEAVAVVAFPEGGVDLDTRADCEEFARLQRY